MSRSPHHGIAVHLAALTPPRFDSLIPLIRWCAEHNLTVLQLLPLNDTGDDPSPYNAISSCALHPKYLGVSEEVLQEEWIASPPSSEPVADWLSDYALFKILSREYGPDWRRWPKELQNPTREDLSLLASAYREGIRFNAFVQQRCFEELIQVHRLAQQLGVQLMGDLPILVSPNSADVWANRTLFTMELEVGAPPDAYAEEGQHWQFPAYNWRTMENNGYAWWKQRLQIAEHFYDLYRIDHIVGFYRFWVVTPDGSSHFLPRRGWIPHGENVLNSLLSSTKMQPIGEDLGTVPTSVKSSLTRLGIPGMRVLRWEKEDPKTFPELSLCTVSTHDSSTLRGWWREEYGKLPTIQEQLALLRTCHQSASRYRINPLQDYLALFPELSYDDPDEERINVPGTISEHNWQLRYRPSVGEIVEHHGLSELMIKITASSP